MRRYGTFPERRNSEGKTLCKWCGGLVPKGRMFFCNANCAFEVQIRRDSGFLRARVKERDHGVCAKCGMDTQRLKRILRFVHQSLRILLGESSWGDAFWFNREMTILYGVNPWRQINEQCKWEADHIVEVVSGGEPYLSNIQTLCVPCHKGKTKQQAGERAQLRRDAKRELLPLGQATATSEASAPTQ